MLDNVLDITSAWSAIMLLWAFILMIRTVRDINDLAVVGLIWSYALLLSLISLRRWLDLPVAVVVPGFITTALSSTIIAIYVTKVTRNNDPRP